MSYFNEPARLAMLNIMGEINKEPTTDKIESKGLLSRINGTSDKANTTKNMSEIDKVIRMANEMIAREQPITNEEIEYEVIIARENGTQEFIHRVEKLGTRSI